MKRLVLYMIVVAFLASCSNSGNGELVGTRKKSKPFYQPDPYGMVFIPQGSYTMGAADEDITNSYLVQPKAISVSAFFMDEAEITNDEYRQFVFWVKDSIARTILGDVRPEEFLVEENEKLTRENQAISIEIDRLKHDLDYIESIARQELGMIGENEIILKPQTAPEPKK